LGGRLYGLAKRALDVTVALLGLVISAPLWALIGIAICLDDGWPVLHLRPCVGEGGRPFDQMKFRSMVRDAERYTGPVLAAENDPRITRVGKWLRRTALDELPQLINILMGEMSFVGPRPERPVLVDRFLAAVPNYVHRFRMRPGLTGLAQVYGYYDTPAKHKLRYDLLYARRRSIWLDARLFALSLVLTARGAWDSRAERPPGGAPIGDSDGAPTGAASSAPTGGAGAAPIGDSGGLSCMM
jgi:lipopolysaccharide/colanic/teichoic acid biosynthesis glycosyltransferase